jgi:Tol biopolymer transport system component
MLLILHGESPMVKRISIALIVGICSLSILSASAADIVDKPNQVISQARQLTFDGPRAGEGYFSRDGHYMIFQSERHEGNPFYQMYVMDLKTGKSTLVSPGQGKTTCGWIHPDMKKVMWSSTHLDPSIKKKVKEEIAERKKPVKSRYSWSYDEHFDIFESDLNGNNQKRLTKELGYDAEGSYSPDGQYIAFASNRHGYTEKLEGEDKKLFQQDPSYMMDIYIMKADGTDVKRLTDVKGYDGGPFFSPDGKKITWRRFAPNGATAEVYTMNMDGTEQKQVTSLNAMSWAPYFHPSGDYLIFSTSVLGYANFELFIVDTAGTKTPVRVTFDDGFDGLGVFSPDGHQVSWTHRNEKGESQIYIAQWDDAKARELLELPPAKMNHQQLLSDIRKQDIKSIIGYLASEEMGGRRAGSPEEKIYTEEIVKWLKSWGLKGGGPKGEFLQTFSFTSGVSLGVNNTLEIMGKMKQPLKVSEDFEPLSLSKSGPIKEAPIAFAGFGIVAPATEKQPGYDSYKNLNVKGHWVLIFRDIPEDAPPELKHHLNLYGRLQHKVTVARNNGAMGVIIVNGPVGSEKWEGIKYDGASETSLPVLRMKNKWADEMLQWAGKNTKQLHAELNSGEVVEGFVLPSLYLKGQIDLKFEKSQATNILAKLQISGQKAILIGAHGDHLGKGEFGSSLAKSGEKDHVHYGADDNASGVAGVLELAHYYSDLNERFPGKIKKDLYFAIWSAEEIGVLGSSHFTKTWSQISKIPFKQYFSAALNMDMIGRFKDRLFVQGVGSGDTWSSLSEQVGSKASLPLSLLGDPYQPTDSMAIYLAHIPSISFFTGVHSDYHSPRDTAEAINYDGTEKVIQTIAEFSDLLTAQTADAVKYVKVKSEAKNLGEGRSFRIYLGTIPDYSQEGVKGVRISGVSKESPAERAGLKEKDVIIEFGGSKIENIYDYVYSLQTVKPDKETGIKIKRGEELVELRITPRLKE